MRRTTLILLIVIVIIGGAAGATVFLRPLLGSDDRPFAEGVAQAQGTPAPGATGTPGPSPTPIIALEPVVVAQTYLPMGERLHEGVLAIEMRPADNIAVQAGIHFTNTAALAGSIIKTQIAKGQEILRPMLALSPNDLAASGSDLALYVDQGRVAVAFPINRYSGLAYAMRPGDHVDVMMSLGLLQLDEAFQTALPNLSRYVFTQDLEDGAPFLSEEYLDEGRLEPVTVADIGLVVEMMPGVGEEQIPRRVTQLTIQQAEVLWVGTWYDPASGRQAFGPLEDPTIQTDPAILPTPTRERPEERPDLVILTMTAQDALALKWALEVGIDIDLALRAQGDDTEFVTTSVSLPQMIEQGILDVPETNDVGLDPGLEEVPTPGVPPLPPNN